MGTKGIIIFKRIFRASYEVIIKVKKISLFSTALVYLGINLSEIIEYL